ncbi:hypothetical protein ACFY93_13115 [Streptomyces sp. NPDC008313]|uniref:hypothetical protein n=1 Tax=Streptomyces sp. NPDC008313 TaxID=3364826 RepID=UPI0036E1392A
MNKVCAPFRPLLTEHLLLGTPLPEELSRHLEECPDCAREAAETDDVVRTLRRVDPLAGWIDTRLLGTPERPSKDLGDRIRREVAGARADDRPRPRPRPRYGRRIALGVAAGFATAAAVAVPLTLDQTQPPPATTAAVVLVRDGSMVERPGGTEVPVALSGLEAGKTYRMMTVNAEGTRLAGGTVRAVDDGPVDTRMVTAMRKDTITALIVEDEDGRVVTRVPVAPSTSG